MQSNSKKQIRSMTVIAILFAVVIVLYFLNIPIIPGALSITFTLIPVAVGAILYGPWCGLALGTMFGLISFTQSMTGDPLGSALLNLDPINALFLFIMCVPTRALMGLGVGLIYKVFRVQENRGPRFHVAHIVANLMAPILNTLLFTSMLVLFFYNTEPIQSIAVHLGANNVFLFIVLLVGLNFLIELAVSLIIGYVATSRLAIIKMKLDSN